jgi:hypothetical protein
LLCANPPVLPRDEARPNSQSQLPSLFAPLTFNREHRVPMPHLLARNSRSDTCVKGCDFR